MSKKIILASASERRTQILINAGFNIEVILPDVLEVKDDNLDITYLVKENAYLKGRDVFNKIDLADNIIVSADTVVFFNGKVIGKPKDRYDAYNILKLLSSNKHFVYSGICIFYDKNKHLCTSDVSEVFFRQLSDRDIENYLKFDEYKDKAGSYAIQGRASFFVERFKGSYLNIVGFPLETFFQLLNKANLDVWSFMI